VSDDRDNVPRHVERTDEVTARTAEAEIWRGKVRELSTDMRDIKGSLARSHDRIGALEHFRTALVGNHDKNGRIGRMTDDIRVLKEWRQGMDEKYGELRTMTTVVAVKVGLVMALATSIVVGVLMLAIKGG
jgi:hypothetical protein